MQIFERYIILGRQNRNGRIVQDSGREGETMLRAIGGIPGTDLGSAGIGYVRRVGRLSEQIQALEDYA